MDVNLHIGRRLRRRRHILGLTQTQLAELVGITFQTIQKYECAQNRLSVEMLWRLSEALQAPPRYFFDGLSEPEFTDPRDFLNLTTAPALSFARSPS